MSKRETRTAERVRIPATQAGNNSGDRAGLVVELGAHAFEYLNQRFWHEKIQGEEAIREFARTPGLQKAMEAFGRLQFPEEGGTVRWAVSEEVGRRLREAARRSMIEGEVRVFSLAVVSILEQTKELEE